MLKINKNLSVIISLVLSFIVVIGLVVALIVLPMILRFYLDLMDKSHLLDSASTILPLLYGVVVVAIVAITALIVLLLRVRGGAIFTPVSVSCLRGISWCCVLEALLFGGLSFFFMLAIPISLAALFMFLLLRVVKNVIEEATAIKAENDYTI